jgi:hypothetical protein
MLRAITSDSFIRPSRSLPKFNERVERTPELVEAGKFRDHER